MIYPHLPPSRLCRRLPYSHLDTIATSGIRPKIDLASLEQPAVGPRPNPLTRRSPSVLFSSHRCTPSLDCPVPASRLSPHQRPCLNNTSSNLPRRRTDEKVPSYIDRHMSFGQVIMRLPDRPLDRSRGTKRRESDTSARTRIDTTSSGTRLHCEPCRLDICRP